MINLFHKRGAHSRFIKQKTTSNENTKNPDPVSMVDAFFGNRANKTTKKINTSFFIFIIRLIIP